MAVPTVSSIVCDEIYITITFSEAVSLTQDPEYGFTVSVDAVARTIVAAEHEAGTAVIRLQVSPIEQGQTVLLSLDNTPPYIYDDATDTDAVVDFTDSAVTNNSTLTTVSFDNTAVYTPELTINNGTITAKVEVELGRSDRDIVSEFGQFAVTTGYTYTASDPDIIVVSTGATALVGDGTIITASLAVSEDNADALIAWQASVRDNLLTALLQARELAAALSRGSTTIYRV